MEMDLFSKDSVSETEMVVTKHMHDDMTSYNTTSYIQYV